MKKGKKLLTFALPYIVIMLLPILTIFSLGNLVTQSYREKDWVEKEKAVAYAFEQFQKRMTGVQEQAGNISRNATIRSYMNRASGSFKTSPYNYLEVIDCLNGFMFNEDVSMIYLYDEWNNHIITNAVGFSEAEMLFQFGYCPEGVDPEEETVRLKGLEDGYMILPWRSVSGGIGNLETIEYSISISVKGSEDHQFVLTCIMDVQDVLGDMLNVAKEKGEFCVYYRDELIYSNMNRYEGVQFDDTRIGLYGAEWNGESTYQMSCSSMDKKWRMHFVQSAEESAVTGFSYVSVIMILPIAASTVLCIFFAFRDHRKIEDILNVMRKRPGGEPPEKEKAYGYQTVKESVQRMVEEREQLRESAQEYKISYKNEVLDKLVHRTYNDNWKDMEKLLEKAEICIRQERCVVVCIRFADAGYRTVLAEEYTMKDLVKELLESLVARRFEMLDTTAREISLCMAVESQEELEKAIQELLAYLNTEIVYPYGIGIQLGVGNIVESVYDISDSYSSAREVIRYHEVSGNEMIFAARMQQAKDDFFYPREADGKVANYVAVLRGQEAREIIENIYNENFVLRQRMLSADAIEELRKNLKRMLYSLGQVHGVEMEEFLEELQEEQNQRLYFDRICAGIDRIIEKLETTRKKRTNELAGKIWEYLMANYSQPTMSLVQVEEAFGFSGKYMTQVFREEYGDSIITVLEKIRLEKACELLRDTENKIYDIAEEVGYTRDQSFRRAFIKVIGISPSEYREKYRN